MDPRLDTAIEVTAIDLGFDSDIYIFAANEDLATTGFDAPIGSVCVQSGGIYQKTDTANTAWSKTPAPGQLDGQVSVGSVSYTAANTVAILVDTTTNAVSITLPGGITKINKFYHIKWVKGVRKNKVTINPAANETIDGETKLILAEIYDNRNLLGHSGGWFIL